MPFFFSHIASTNEPNNNIAYVDFADFLADYVKLFSAKHPLKKSITYFNLFKTSGTISMSSRFIFKLYRIEKTKKKPCAFLNAKYESITSTNILLELEFGWCTQFETVTIGRLHQLEPMWSISLFRVMKKLWITQSEILIHFFVSGAARTQLIEVLHCW